VAADLGVEDLQCVGVGRVAQQTALRFEHEAGCLYFPDDRCRVDAMQCVGIAKARSGLRRVVYDHECTA
jgi:hypothetical protein